MSLKLSAAPVLLGSRDEQKPGEAAPLHPALLALVRLLARQAAEELTLASASNQGPQHESA
jgi:hypothetical protein